MTETVSEISSFISSKGTLTVQVAESENAVPIQNALVTITETEGGKQVLKYLLTTDASGRTPAVELPAPNEDSNIYPAEKMPYSIYYVRISHPGYYTEAEHMVQIFRDSVSYLNINMIPLPEFPEKEVIVY